VAQEAQARALIQIKHFGTERQQIRVKGYRPRVRPSSRSQPMGPSGVLVASAPYA
jgi:hypothetical protein